MEQNQSNPYTTEIPVSEAEKELHHPQVYPPLTERSVTPPTTPPSLPPRVDSQTKSKLPMIIVAVLLLVIGFLAGYIIRGMMTTPTPPPVAKKIVPPTAPTATSTPTPVPQASVSANPSSNEFSSPELGISFNTAKILPDTEEETVRTQINGSRVYVYRAGTQATTGQYVDVLSKISTDTTAIAAQKITTKDPTFASCTFEIAPQITYPPTYEKVVPNCVSQNQNGVSFFLSDSAHPTKLLFFNLGQYGLQASDDPQLLWQDTLRFL